MVFSNITDRNGLIQECERITGLGATAISGNTTLLQDFTARINNSVDRFFAIALSADSQWQFDDRNHTDLPIATTNLVSGQQDYQFSTELLAVTQVFVKDSNGVYNEIHPQDDKTNPAAYLTTTTGIPTSYELVGNSILLSPIPNYASATGLKVTFKRNGVKFRYDDGAVPVGIPSLFHSFLARDASLTYLIDKNRASKNDIGALVVRDELEIKKFISNRAKPKSFGLRTSKESNK